MPIIEIHLRTGRTDEQKRNLHEKVAAAVVDAVQCDINTVRIMITEHDAHGFSVAGKLKAYDPPTGGS